jgi:glycosyltransferase involved in cell wall biosynthesis
MSANKRKKILVMVDWYEPGFKAGGPIRSCVNFAHYMKSNYEVRVFTSDRDLGEIHPYKDIGSDKWLEKEGMYIFYCSQKQLSWRKILSEIQQQQPEYVYLNSLFSKYFAVYPLLMKRLGRIKGQVILAPRGMLKETALQFKPLKKQFFLFLFKILNFQKYIHFHATDSIEEYDIKKNFGNATQATHIVNFPGIQNDFIIPTNKEAGSLKMIFIGRIHPIKNLYFLLQSLQVVSARVQLTIAGVLEDEQYWQRCSELISSLSANLTVTFIRDVPHHELEDILYQQHVFVLPTQGENFGHAIFESLAAGRPVLISDQTPWRNLEKNRAGWDLPLTDFNAFTRAIEGVAAMNNAELTLWCRGAWHLANDFIRQTGIKQQYLNLFK